MKGIRSFVLLTIAASLVAVFSSTCTVTPESYVIAKANGEPITLKEVTDHPFFKSLVDQIATRIIIKQKAAEQGITVDNEAVKKRLDDMITQIGPGPSWERWKQSQGLTDEDLNEQFRIEYLLEQILKARVSLTEEEIKGRFEANPLFYRRQYARENNMTDEEAEKLTYEDVRDWVKNYIVTSEAYAQGQNYIGDLLALADVEYFFLSPEQRARIDAEKAEKRKAIKEREKAVSEALEQVEAEKSEEEPKTVEESTQGKEGEETKGKEEPDEPKGKPADENEDKKDTGQKKGEDG